MLITDPGILLTKLLIKIIYFKIISINRKIICDKKGLIKKIIIAIIDKDIIIGTVHKTINC